MDPVLLRASLEQVFARHPILRTTFDLGSFSAPLQLVHQQGVISLTIYDLCHLSLFEQEKVLAEHIQRISCEYFDVTKLPLINFSVHYLSGGRLQFSIAAHHAILDGWSLVTLLIELVKKYSAIQQSENAPLIQLPNAMRDLVIRERKALD